MGPPKKSINPEIVNQPKITSFFVKLDPNAPRPSPNPADLRQTKLGFGSRGPGSGTQTKTNGSRSRNSKSRKKGKRARRKLTSTKNIPEEDVIVLSSSDDSNDGTLPPTPSPADSGMTNGFHAAVTPVVAPSASTSTSTSRRYSSAEAEPVAVAGRLNLQRQVLRDASHATAEHLEDANKRFTNTRADAETQKIGEEEFVFKSPGSKIRTAIRRSNADLNVSTTATGFTTEEETQLIGNDDPADSGRELNESQIETQFDDVKPTTIRTPRRNLFPDDCTNSPDKDSQGSCEPSDRSRSSSPSLLRNCDPQLVRSSSQENLFVNDKLNESGLSGGALVNLADNQNLSQSNKSDSANGSSLDFDELLEQAIEQRVQELKLDPPPGPPPTPSPQLTKPSLPNAELETQLLGIGQSEDEPSPTTAPTNGFGSPSASTRGAIYVTPIKNLQEPSTPTKSGGPSSSSVGRKTSATTPSKFVRSKVPYFSPVRHLNSPSKKGGTRGVNGSTKKVAQNLEKYFSPSPLKNPHQQTQAQQGSQGQGSQGSASSGYNTRANTAAPQKPPVFSSQPYFLENFVAILNAVTTDAHHAHLLNEDDLTLIKKFNELSTEAKCLYIQLFRRQWNWKPASTIKYEKIAPNLDPHFEALYGNGLLLKLEDEVDEMELRSLIQVLNGEQIASLAKKMGLKLSSKTKESCMEGLLKLTKNQRTLSGSSSKIIAKETCQLLGPTYKVSPDSKSLFSRIFILFSPPQYWEEETDQGSNTLLTSLLTKIGKMQYATYRISKSTKIYPTRDDLMRFQDGWTLHSEIQAYTDPKIKDWDSAQAICDEALEQFTTTLQNLEIQTHDGSLPSFLRAFTAGGILSRTIFLGIDAFQKTKNYGRANEILQILLSQTLYSTHSRGKWIDRLLINMKHLKKTDEQLRQIILTGLQDSLMKDSHKLGLTRRLEKLKPVTGANGSGNAKKRSAGAAAVKPRRSKRTRRSTTARARVIESSEDEEVQVEEVEVEEEEEEIQVAPEQPDTALAEAAGVITLQHEIPNRIISGEKFAMGENIRGKSVFIGPDSSSTVNGNSASSVEAFAIQYYKRYEGYDYGAHAEGAIPVTIFGLLFWDVIYYDELPDVFHSPYQPHPLDIHFDEFYQQRQHLIQEKIANLRSKWSLSDVLEIMETNWEKHYATLSIVVWNAFDSVDQMKGLIKSMGLQLIADLCERLATNFRHFRAGFPDLILWNSTKCLFVEVKGPGDTLSTKQCLWLEYLASVKANVEICFVESVSNKRIR